MKSLRESIEESVEKTNESLTGLALGLSVAKLIGLIAIAEAMLGNHSGSMATSLNPLEHIKSEGGVVLGVVSWIMEIGERISDKITDAKFRKNVDKLKNSDEFKAYLELPKKKQTLKELVRIAKETCDIRDTRPAIRVWDEIKKGAPANVQNVKITE